MRRCARRGFLPPHRQGCRHDIPPCRTDSHTIQLCGPRELCRHQCDRHSQHLPGGERHGHGASHRHLDIRGLRHGAVCAHRREAPPSAPVALLGDKDWGRRDSQKLFQRLQPAGSHRTAFQHLRTAPERPGNHPHHNLTDSQRREENQGGRPLPHPRLQFRRGHLPRIPGIGPGRRYRG